MRIIDSVKRAGRSLGSAKGRTILTALAIAVGAFTLTAALAAGTGARQYANKLIESNIDPQSIFVTKEETMFGSSIAPSLREYDETGTQYQGINFKTLSDDDIDLLKQIEGVSAVTPTYIVSAQYIVFEGNDTKYSSDITAYDPSVRADTASGELPPLGEQLKPGEIVVPQSFAEVLKKSPDEMIGTTIKLHVIKSTTVPSQEEIESAFLSGGTEAVEQLIQTESRDEVFKVRAVSAKSSTSFSASAALFVSDTDAKRLADYITSDTPQHRRYITATVTARDGVDPVTVKSTIEETSKERGDDQLIIARTAKDLQDLLFTIVNIIQSIVVVFGVLALMASVFGIINTQYISVLERTREIGLMKALGMRGRHVSRLFQYEAAWIGLLGGALGSLLAWSVGTALNPWLSSIMSIGDNRILVFEFWPAVGLVVGLMILAMVAGWFPARKASKLDPIEALRTE